MLCLAVSCCVRIFVCVCVYVCVEHSEFYLIPRKKKTNPNSFIFKPQNDTATKTEASERAKPYIITILLQFNHDHKFIYTFNLYASYRNGCSIAKIMFVVVVNVCLWLDPITIACAVCKKQCHGNARMTIY